MPTIENRIFELERRVSELEQKISAMNEQIQGEDGRGLPMEEVLKRMNVFNDSLRSMNGIPEGSE